VGFREFGWIDKAGFFIPKDPQAPNVPDFEVPEFARFLKNSVNHRGRRGKLCDLEKTFPSKREATDRMYVGSR
jgi:hypothetical protein